MKSYEKEVLDAHLKNEQATLRKLKQTYKKSLDEINTKIAELMGRSDATMQHVIYQVEYQKALKKQIEGILTTMEAEQFKTISDYLTKSYEDGFVGAMYSLQKQGIPLCFPINQAAVVKAVTLDSKISKGLYTRLGEDVTKLKNKISAEVSRGISTGASYQQVAQNLAKQSNIGYNNAVRITATEGHRIQVQSAMDACEKAKESGAEIVKQWDSTLDGKTRPSHKKVDGELRELDQTFSNGLMFPGDPKGGASEVVRCRCALLQRAKWALDEDELEELKQRAEFFGLDKTENFEDYKKKYLAAAEEPAPEPVKPKKVYQTEKKLKEQISDIEKEMQELQSKYGGKILDVGSEDDQVKFMGLESMKNDLQGKLDKKVMTKQKKKLKKEQILLQDKLDSYPMDTYSNIWKDDVSTVDWAAKKDSISKKKAYFEQQLQYATDPADIEKWESLLAALDDFDKKGSGYHDLQQKLAKVKADLTKLEKSGKISTKDLDAFTQERKDSALWAKSTKEADSKFRDTCGDVWKASTKQEQYAIYDYTVGSGKFNRPLSGFEKPYNLPGTGWESRFHKGVGNVWIDFEGAGDEIRKMTDMISRSSYDFDVWLQHGCKGSTLESFLNLPEGSFQRMTNDELQQFVGTANRRYSFMSCGVSKGKGFSDQPIIVNVYAPKGTQMMYAEPFSHFGLGGKLNWDGNSEQSSFGYEAEMIIQRGASFEITKIEKVGGKIYIDMDLHPEDGYDLIQQDPEEWKGSKKKGR